MRLDRFEDLSVWQEARTLVKLVYRITLDGGFSADRDLVRQMRRAAISAMANIAEGFSRYSIKDSRQFYIMARGSLAELRSHAYVASDLLYVSEADAEAMQSQIEATGKLLSGLIRNAQRRLDVVKTGGTIEPMNH